MIRRNTTARLAMLIACSTMQQSAAFAPLAHFGAVRVPTPSVNHCAIPLGSPSKRFRPLAHRNLRMTSEAGGVSKGGDTSPTKAVSYSKTKDILSGLVVALTSIPASTAFANIAGVNPLLGIWSSVILGLISAIIGGRSGLIAGAAGVVAVPLAPLIAQHGVAYMFPTVMLAALIEGTASLLKAGRLISLVTDSVMKGFLNGLGCLLFKSQLPVFLALSGASLSAAVGVAAVTALVTFFLPRVTTEVPSSLVGVVLATILTQVLALPVPTLADVSGAEIFAGGVAVLPSFSAFPAVALSLATFKIILPVALSIAFISILETLLAGKVVAEYKANEGGSAQSSEEESKSNNRMLAGLSTGTFAAGLFGGFGGCGLIPQTLLNMQSGGRGRLSSLSYGVAMAACVVLAAPVIGTIPLASLAGVMLTVALSTVQPAATIEHAKAAVKASSPGARTDFVALVALLRFAEACAMC